MKTQGWHVRASYEHAVSRRFASGGQTRGQLARVAQPPRHNTEMQVNNRWRAERDSVPRKLSQTSTAKAFQPRAGYAPAAGPGPPKKRLNIAIIYPSFP
jgi:hypothetical protein